MTSTVNNKQAHVFTLTSLQAIFDNAGIFWKMENSEIKADIGADRWAINLQKQVALNIDSGKGSTLFSLLKSKGLLDAAYIAEARQYPVKQVVDNGKKSFVAQRMWANAVDMAHPANIKADLVVPYSAAVRYFQARFNPAEAKVTYQYARVALPDTKYDKEFIDQACCAVVILPMYQGDVLSGIQRTYITSKGIKLGRRMLGKHGFLMVKGSENPIQANMILLGEGFETTISGVLLSGCSAVVCYDTGGLSKYAVRYAEGIEKEREAGQDIQDIRVGLLVDRDKSKAGETTCQKAGIRLMNAGVDVVLLNTQTVLPEHVKSIDWNDEFKKYGLEAGRVAIELAYKDGLASQHLLNENVISINGVRLALNPLPIAETVSMEEARTITQNELVDFVNESSRWNRLKKEAKEYSDYLKVNPKSRSIEGLEACNLDEDGKFNLMPPTVALQITTGVGKSHAVRDIISRLKNRGMPAVIVVKDKEAASVYESAGAEWRHGREFNVEGFKVEWHCPHAKADGSVARLADAEQLIGSSMCNTGHCDHGNRLMLDEKDIHSEDTAKQPSVTVIKWYKNKVEAIGEAGVEAIEPCGFLPHMKAAQNNLVIVVTSAGLGGNELFYTEKAKNSKPITTPRLVIIDEAVKWQHSRHISADTIASYVNQMSLTYSKISSLEDNSNGDILKVLEDAEKLYRNISLELGKASGTQGGSLDASPELTALASEIGNITEEHKQALWEKPVWNNLTEMDSAPLRSAYEITLAAKLGCLTIVDGALLIVYTHPVVSEALGQQPVIIMDATLDANAKAIVRSKQGKIVDIRAKQNIKVIVDPRRFRGAVAHEAEREERLDKESDEMLVTLNSFKQKTGKDVFVIGQKPKSIRLLSKVAGVPVDVLDSMDSSKIQEISVKHRIGWWGRHDKGLDAWKGCDGILWDQSAIRVEELRKLWIEHRSLRISLGENPADVSHWTDDWLMDEWIPMGQYDQQSRARVHANPEIRAFILDYINDQRIQAIGRARAACSKEDINLLVLGGLPIPQLREHGIAVEYQTIGLATRDERAGKEHQQRKADVRQTALKLVADNKQITREAIGAEMDKTTGKTRVHTYSEFIEEDAEVFFKHFAETGRNAQIMAKLAEIKKEHLLSALDISSMLNQFWAMTVQNYLDGDLDGTMVEAIEQIEVNVKAEVDAGGHNLPYWEPRLAVVRLIRDELMLYDDFDFDAPPA
ncbi:MAG: hypothetical protein ACYCY2_03095 [Acidithiobacillus ferriphilus]